MNEKAIRRFKSYFTLINLKDFSALEEIYANNILFHDPIHKIEGLENLKRYFQKLNDNLIEGNFHFTNTVAEGNQYCLEWTMDLNLKRPKKRIQASGLSRLVVEQKIIEQRDYFDVGELFYENVPLLGFFIKALKKQIAK